MLEATSAYGMVLEGMEILGDHQLQYVDINIKALLQLNSHDIGSPSSRRLKSTDPKCIEKYCETVQKHFKNHNIYARLEKLWDEVKNK